MSSGKGSGPVYTVEARITNSEFGPRDVCGKLLDCEWRHIEFERSKIGIPADIMFTLAAEDGYVSRTAAMALAWWVLAATRFEMVEVRIVEHHFEYSYSVEQKAFGEPFTRPEGCL